MNTAEQIAGSVRATTIPLHPVARAVRTASAVNDAAPRAEAALPPRSRVPAITGAPSGVLIVAASAFSPQTSRLLPWTLVCPNTPGREYGNFSNSHRPSPDGTFRVDAPE